MPFSTSVIIGSAGTVTIESNNSFVCYVTWGSFISPFRWSRLWAPVQSPGDADYHQAVTITSEGSQWDLSNPPPPCSSQPCKAQGARERPSSRSSR